MRTWQQDFAFVALTVDAGKAKDILDLYAKVAAEYDGLVKECNRLRTEVNTVRLLAELKEMGQ